MANMRMIDSMSHNRPLVVQQGDDILLLIRLVGIDNDRVFSLTRPKRIRFDEDDFMNDILLPDGV